MLAQPLLRNATANPKGTQMNADESVFYPVAIRYKFRERAIAAIRKFIVAMRTPCDRKLAKTSAKHRFASVNLQLSVQGLLSR